MKLDLVKTGQRQVARQVSFTLVAATALAHVFSSVPSMADDLLPDTAGEIIFESTPVPPLATIEPDPLLQERLERAAARKLEQQEALDRLREAMTVSETRTRELQESVAALDKDRATLVDQLIETAKAIQDMEDQLARSEGRLIALREREKVIRNSLAKRRDILSEVLGALQRVGRNPPPALFVSASDALSSVRSAILLGAILPELREEAALLIDDLEDLRTVAQSVSDEQTEMIAQQTRLSEEQVRLDLLIKENHRLKTASEETLGKERETATLLAAKATNLRELVAGLEQDIAETERRASERITEQQAEWEARRAALEEERAREFAAITALQPLPEPIPVTNDGPAQFQLIAGRDPSTESTDNASSTEDRLGGVDQGSFYIQSGALSFSENKGLLNYPARGVKLASYGERDSIGAKREGISIATRARAPVVAPAAGRVRFAGEFRTFRQLLILDMGEGYHVVMAGMNEITVDVGDIVRAGEPVAVMGGDRVAQLTGTIGRSDVDFFSGQTQPVLYVEFRKDGRSFDSSSWWATP